MSKPNKVKITCPSCKKETDFVIWESINTTINPELKASVRDLSLFRCTCPECGAVNTINYCFLYHQMEDSVLIYYANTEEAAEEQYRFVKGDDMWGMFGKDYMIRIVRSYNELLEKLRMIDHGLDDRVVEIYKLLILGDYQKANPDNRKNIDMLYYFHEKPMIQLTSEGEYVCSAEFSMDAYNKIREEFSPRFPENNREEPFIDRKWALDILKNASK